MNPSYPPLPYPPIVSSSIPTKRSAEERINQERELTQSTSAARAPPPSSPSPRDTSTGTMRKTLAKKRVNPFSNGKLAPFKAVSRIAPKTTPTPLRTPRYTPSLPYSPPTSNGLHSPEPAQITLLKSPFRTPTFSRSTLNPPRSHMGRSTSTVGLARDLAEMEKRVELLKRARQFQEANLLETDESTENLIRLGTKWKIIGRKAAELLWEHTASSTPIKATYSPTSPLNSSDEETEFSKYHEQRNASHAPSLSSSTYLTQLSTSHYSSSSTYRAPETTAEFLLRIDQIARENQSTREVILDRMMDDEFEPPTLEELRERERRTSVRDSGNKVHGAMVGDDAEEDGVEEYDELDTPSDRLAYARKIAKEQRAVDSFEGDDDSQKDGTQIGVARWNVGEMMRLVGVDPDLFGSRNDEGDFDDRRF